jgi:hypothetical protein
MATIDELGIRAAARVRGQVRPYVSLDVPTLPQSRSPRRWAVLAAAALVVAAVATTATLESTRDHREPTPSGSTAPDTTSPTRAQGFDVTSNELTFHLPGVFRYSTEGFASTGEGYGNFYSTAPMPHGPCTAGCGIGNLAPTTPNTVVIGIGSIALPLDPNDHPNTTIAGLDAHFVTSAECGDELISVRVESFGETIVRACLSGPDLASGERIVREILATATRIGEEATTTPTTARPDLDVNLDPSTTR